MIQNSQIHLIEYFPHYTQEDSIFQKMVPFGAPWNQETALVMDRSYFLMYSGIKPPSSYLYFNSIDGHANSQAIAQDLFTIYGQNWTKLYEAFMSKYVPINNYDMTETVTRTQTSDRTITRTNDLTSTIDGTETRTQEQYSTQNLTGNTTSTTTSDSNSTSALDHGETIASDTTTDSYTYGFNSPEKVPTASQTATNTDTHSGTDTTTTTEHSSADTTATSKSDTTDHMTGTTDITSKDVRADRVLEDTLDNDDVKEDIQTNRSGNIGVTSTQQLLQQEFELWKYNFFNQVFEDVDKYLTLSVYDCGTFERSGYHILY